jgi:uncharacterized protein with HEPN domain
MARSTKDRLKDIIQSLDDVENLADGLSYEDFQALPVRDRKTYLALSGAFTQMGEAIKTLPAEMTSRHEHIRWAGIAGMRDVLVHHYHRVEIDIIWDTVSGDDLIVLRVAIETELGVIQS